MRSRQSWATWIRCAACVALASLGGFGLVSCGTSDSGSGGGAGAGNTSTCTLVDVCAKIALAHVNALCGTTITSTMLTSMESPDPNQLPRGDVCDYDGSAQVVRDCYSSTMLASYFFTQSKMQTPTDVTQTDVTGVGDQAFLRDDSQLMQSKLYVLKGNLYVIVTADWSSGGQKAASACLQTLAAETLAL